MTGTIHSCTTAALVSISIDLVDEDHGIGNGDEAILLVDAGVASQTMHGLVDGVVGGGFVCHTDEEGHVPLGKLGPGGVVGNVIIVEAIEAAAPDRARVPPHKGLEAGDDLNCCQRTSSSAASESFRGLAAMSRGPANKGRKVLVREDKVGNRGGHSVLRVSICGRVRHRMSRVTQRLKAGACRQSQVYTAATKHLP